MDNKLYLLQLLHRIIELLQYLILKQIRCLKEDFYSERFSSLAKHFSN
jgi:hypothetical protein